MNPQDLKDKMKNKDDTRTADLIDQMSSPIGRRYVWQVLVNLGYQQPITDVGASVYGKVARQGVAIGMVEEMKKKCRDLFYVMEIENDGLGS